MTLAADLLQVKTILKNDQKHFKKKSLNTFLISTEKGQVKGLSLIGKFFVFKQLVFLPLTKLYMHGITFSDNFNFLVTGILIFKALSFFK